MRTGTHVENIVGAQLNFEDGILVGIKWGGSNENDDYSEKGDCSAKVFAPLGAGK